MKFRTITSLFILCIQPCLYLSAADIHSSVVPVLAKGQVVIPSIDQKRVETYSQSYAVEEARMKKVKAALASFGITAAVAYALYVARGFFVSDKESTTQCLHQHGLGALAEFVQGIDAGKYNKIQKLLSEDEDRRSLWGSWFWSRWLDFGSGVARNLLWGLGVQGVASCVMSVVSRQFPLVDVMSVRNSYWFFEHRTSLGAHFFDISHCLKSVVNGSIDGKYMQALVNAVVSQTEQVLGFMVYRKHACGKKAPVTQELLDGYIRQFECKVIEYVTYVISHLENGTMPLDLIAMNCDIKQQDIRLIVTHFVQVAR